MIDDDKMNVYEALDLISHHVPVVGFQNDSFLGKDLFVTAGKDKIGHWPSDRIVPSRFLNHEDFLFEYQKALFILYKPETHQ